MASTLDHSQFKKYAKIRDYDWSGNAEFQVRPLLRTSTRRD